jgi:hypothetical protein
VAVVNKDFCSGTKSFKDLKVLRRWQPRACTAPCNRERWLIAVGA